MSKHTHSKNPSTYSDSRLPVKKMCEANNQNQNDAPLTLINRLVDLESLLYDNSGIAFPPDDYFPRNDFLLLIDWCYLIEIDLCLFITQNCCCRPGGLTAGVKQTLKGDARRQ